MAFLYIELPTENYQVIKPKAKSKSTPPHDGDATSVRHARDTTAPSVRHRSTYTVRRTTHTRSAGRMQRQNEPLE
jgi:hypothetical protein